MKKQLKPEITVEKIGENPFLDKLKIRVNKLAIPGQYFHDRATGFELPVEIDLEMDKSCKVFVDKDRRLVVASLSSRARDLYLWLIYELENGAECMWINNKRYMSEMGIKSYNTYKDSLTELIKRRIVMRSAMPSVFWINPDMFFNGSRLKVFPKNVVRK